MNYSTIYFKSHHDLPIADNQFVQLSFERHSDIEPDDDEGEPVVISSGSSTSVVTGGKPTRRKMQHQMYMVLHQKFHQKVNSNVTYKK